MTLCDLRYPKSHPLLLPLLLSSLLFKAEARDKICRAIQYGSKFLRNGEPGTAQNVAKSMTLAGKVFRLFKPKEPPLPLILLGKNKERVELIGRISLLSWMGSSVCATFVELAELKRLSTSMKWLARELKKSDKYKNEEFLKQMNQSNERFLALLKASMDMVVAVGLLQLAPKKVTPRVNGGFGFITSLISCYQLLPSPPNLSERCAKLFSVPLYLEVAIMYMEGHETQQITSVYYQVPTDDSITHLKNNTLC